MKTKAQVTVDVTPVMKRIVALQCAVRSLPPQSVWAENDVVDRAEYFLSWINKDGTEDEE
jgi:hypothetical protein